MTNQKEEVLDINFHGLVLTISGMHTEQLHKTSIVYEAELMSQDSIIQLECHIYCNQTEGERLEIVRHPSRFFSYAKTYSRDR